MNKRAMTDAARRFIESLFGADEAAAGRILIWTPKRSEWFGDAASAAAHAADQPDRYVGVSLVDLEAALDARADDRVGRPDRATIRGEKAQCVGIGGLWADIDFAHSLHKKTNLPPTIQDAVLVAEQAFREHAPSWIVRSGHGIQAWWCFREPWIFETADDQARAARLVRGWQDQIRDQAGRSGWTIDSTHDLTRIMRIPGTWNAKGDRILVTASDSGLRYEPDDMIDHLDDVRPGSQTSAPILQLDLPTIRVDADARPPLEKWDALREAEPRAADSFHRRNPDVSDKSPSGYDLSLATYAAMACWTDQEICDLICAARAKAGDAPKHLKAIQLTIRRARISAEKYGASREILDNVELGVPFDVDPQIVERIGEERAQHEARLDALNKELFVQPDQARIIRILRYATENGTSTPTYRLETNRGVVDLGPVNGLIDQGSFRGHVASVTGVLIKGHKAKEWWPVAQQLLAAVETIDPGEESTPEGMVRDMVDHYLSTCRIGDDPEAAACSRDPYRREGRVRFWLSGLVGFNRVHGKEALKQEKLAKLLRAVGVRQVVQQIGGKRYRVWETEPMSKEE